MKRKFPLWAVVSMVVCLLAPIAVFADDDNAREGPSACKDVPDFTAVHTALADVAPSPTSANGGLNFNMWASIVNRDGVVCVVTFTGPDRGAQWPGSRVISAQKANTANAFSLPGFALSTANLFSAVQPGGTLFGLQHSNPVSTDAAYRGSSKNYGQSNDPMVGRKIGGVNVFGGGLALYNREGTLVGALGVSGDTSCTDHVVAWKVRHALNFDNVPGGVAPPNPLAPGTDNIIFDISEDGNGHAKSTSGFGHPVCGGVGPAQATSLVTNFPVGPNP
jgi:uncharacterized protein GlcG (DUF336 family)